MQPIKRIKFIKSQIILKIEVGSITLSNLLRVFSIGFAALTNFFLNLLKKLYLKLSINPGWLKKTY